jgi:hypothetical protein
MVALSILRQAGIESISQIILNIDSENNRSYNAPMKIATLLVLLIFPLAWGQAPTSDSIPYNAVDSLQKAIDMSLLSMKMYRGDLTFRGDYLEEDPYRFTMIDDYMKAPLNLIGYAGSIVDLHAFPGMKYESMLQQSEKAEPLQVTSEMMRRADSLLSRKNKTALGPNLTQIVEQLLSLAAITDPQNWPQYMKYSPAQRDSLAYGFMLLLEENVDDEFRTVDQLDSIANYEDDWAQQLIRLADGCQGRGRIVDPYLDFLSSLGNERPIFPASSRNLRITTPYGVIIIGDTTASIFNGDPLIVIDPGGDDVYNLQYSGTGHQTYIIDFGGNDTYNLPRNRISPFTFGANLIVDFNGDDTYDAGSWTLGAGMFGVGILWDKSGNDKYYGDTFTEGAGCFGVGILRDDSGNDSYQGALYAQGFGFVDGIGILTDSSGNDSYFAGGKYKDILRYKDHYLSLSQGFAYGIRPKMSGGIGLLIDESGNDVYVSDIFGQGSSYWYSLGVLADGGGNDHYVSFQYAQGAATHMTLGVLYDVSGDDNYSSKGVSQGCGHDRAAGMLIDLNGNDNYVAYDLSQGAGSANGLGLIADIRGNDAFVVRSDKNTQGFGQERRDYGSIGIFIDLGGKDGYAGGVGRDSTWWSDSHWGAGIDR